MKNLILIFSIMFSFFSTSFLPHTDFKFKTNGTCQYRSADDRLVRCNMDVLVVKKGNTLKLLSNEFERGARVFELVSIGFDYDRNMLFVSGLYTIIVSIEYRWVIIKEHGKPINTYGFLMSHEKKT